MVIEIPDLRVVDVESKDDDGGKRAARAEGPQLLHIVHQVAAAIAGSDATRAKIFQLAKALDQGQAEEEKDGEIRPSNRR